MTHTDESIGKNPEGRKLYMVEGFSHPQVLGYKFRIVKRSDGYALQYPHYKCGNGEMTEQQWVDIPVEMNQEI